MAAKELPRRILVTGGAGFIGSATIRYLVESAGAQVLNYDKLSYAANLKSLEPLHGTPNYQLVQADVCDRDALQAALVKFQPDAIIHAAAETHVDRSIANPAEFIQTNLVGTYTLLEACRGYWADLSADRRKQFRLLHVSTDEVYGSLKASGSFTESSPYEPHSPYAASKAGGDHLVMAWYHTYGLPVLLTHCSNNYGPCQFSEKLIPRMVLNAIVEKPMPIYGTGENVRDWIYVNDHARALGLVLSAGRVGETYNIGGDNERTNLEIVAAICDILDSLRPRSSGSYRELIEFVPDRPGHDLRYALDTSKISTELGWRPEQSFEMGLRQTVQWYLDNPE